MTREEEFIKSLYDEANEQLKEVYKEQKENRDKLLQELALIMLTYTVLNGLMSLTSKDKNKEYKSLSKLIINATKGQTGTQKRVINDILNNTVKKTFNFYSYNANLKDVRKIIENNFKGKHFSTRVWDNEKEVSKRLHKQVKNFLDGKINVNQIKRDIQKTYNSSAYEAKRLTETEISRCEDEAFKRFCREVNVKRVRRNEVLDRRTCDVCAAIDGKVYDLDDAPGVVHPSCRGFNTVEDDEIKESNIILKKQSEEYINDETDFKGFIKNIFFKTNFNNEVLLLNDLPEIDRVNITEFISLSPPKFQKLILIHADEIRFLDIDYKKGAHYSPKFNGICLDLKKDRNNLHGKGSYTTLFHELGHLLDKNMGRPSTNFRLSPKFKDAIIKDSNNFIINIKKSYDIQSKIHLYEFISEQLKEKREYHSISDIFGGITQNKVKGNFSHSKDYWEKQGALERETFAHFFEATIRNDKIKLDMIRNILPNAYNIFINLLNEV